MKLIKILDQSCAGSSTTTGSAFKCPIPITDTQTALVQFATDSVAPGDIALQGRLSDHASLTTWQEITLLANGAIQIVPRCFEYRIVVTNSSGSAVNVAAWIGA